ncbi:hypothetical protein [Halococcus thailandensis]|uniref:hypothetical protein n=1 Tax=Halococcus thailandensis TaxID=335952 RepID=UPI00187DB47C|nr:hypothetical protein [Halococcus thailandensis]
MRDVIIPIEATKHDDLCCRSSAIHTVIGHILDDAILEHDPPCLAISLKYSNTGRSADVFRPWNPTTTGDTSLKDNQRIRTIGERFEKEGCAIAIPDGRLSADGANVTNADVTRRAHRYASHRSVSLVDDEVTEQSLLDWSKVEQFDRLVGLHFERDSTFAEFRRAGRFLITLPDDPELIGAGIDLTACCIVSWREHDEHPVLDIAVQRVLDGRATVRITAEIIDRIDALVELERVALLLLHSFVSGEAVTSVRADTRSTVLCAASKAGGGRRLRKQRWRCDRPRDPTRAGEILPPRAAISRVSAGYH